MTISKIPAHLITKSDAWSPSLHEGYLQETNSWFTLRKKQHFELKSQPKQITSNAIRCERIQLKPSIKQRHRLLTWFELSRIAYNMTIMQMRKDNSLSYYQMRKKIKEKMRSNKYILGLIKNSGIYQQTLDNSVKDVYKARKTAISNLKQGNIKFFRLRYKRKNHHIQNMVLETDALGKNGKGLKKKGLTDLKPSSPIKTDKITRIGYNSRTGSITMYVPYDKTTDTQVKREHVCALDPGIRTFQTLYSPSGITYQFGDEKNVIKKTLKRIEKIKNMKDKPWYKRYTRRLREKVKNRIADLHWKTASFLCKNFDNILVGNMSTKGIVKKSLNLHSSNKQMIYALSHFLFKERLKSKAEEYNCFVKIVDESYTSKTCGRCGIINNNLGSSKKFLCPKYMCFYRMDRDIHGARNIYLKNKCFVS